MVVLHKGRYTRRLVAFGLEGLLEEPAVDDKVTKRAEVYKQQVTLYGHRVTAYGQHTAAYGKYLAERAKEEAAKREVASKSCKACPPTQVEAYKEVVKGTLASLVNSLITALLGWAGINATAGVAMNYVRARPNVKPEELKEVTFF